MWAGKFIARANKKGYRNVILGLEIVPKQTEILDSNTHKKEIEIREANQEAFDDLMMAMDEKVCYGKVEEAKTIKTYPMEIQN